MQALSSQIIGLRPCLSSKWVAQAVSAAHLGWTGSCHECGRKASTCPSCCRLVLSLRLVVEAKSLSVKSSRWSEDTAIPEKWARPFARASFAESPPTTAATTAAAFASASVPSLPRRSCTRSRFRLVASSAIVRQMAPKTISEGRTGRLQHPRSMRCPKPGWRADRRSSNAGAQRAMTAQSLPPAGHTPTQPVPPA
eukprot:7389502-Prymnesium_polylepis.2